MGGTFFIGMFSSSPIVYSSRCYPNVEMIKSLQEIDTIFKLKKIFSRWRNVSSGQTVDITLNDADISIPKPNYSMRDVTDTAGRGNVFNER